MKNIKILTLLFLTLIGLTSCLDDDNNLTYVAAPAGEFTFSNSFLSEYVLTAATSKNLGERFTWNSADFGVQTNITYELQKSIIGDFSDLVVIGSTAENSLAITIGDLLDYAREAGLDNDPATESPNTGSISFRLRAFVGDSNSDTDTLSPIVSLTVVLPENTGTDLPICEFDQIWIVGAGVPDAGWGWTTPVKLPCTGDGVYSGNIRLQNNDGADNNFRFFTAEGDWDSGRNFPFYNDAGYTIDAGFEDALDGDNNFAFNGTSGFYNLEIDTNNKTITISAPKVTGVCEFDQLWIVGAGTVDAGWGWTSPVKLVCNGEGIYAGSVNLQNNGGADNNFRFFTAEGDWDSGKNFPYYIGEGYTIDAAFEDAMDGDNNFAFTGTTGAYFLTVDTVAKTITLK
ncbi:MAG: SusE domain-containing protein [Lutibacter sp.]|nr:SusE domain-containing protein [Lutibacter sp.]